MEIVDETGSAAYVRLAAALLEAPAASPRGLATRELTDVTLVLTDPSRVHVLGTSRRPNLKIAATEALHLVGGISSLAQLDLASGGRFSPFADGGRLRGAYGPRARAQLLAVEARLRRDPDTRQAVVTLWRGDELPADTRDTPCTVSLQFLLRDGQLRLRVSMRSNDFWLGVPYDLMMFGCLQRTLAAALGVEPGSYTHTVGSLHVYDDHVAQACLEKILDHGVSDAWRPHADGAWDGIPAPPPWNLFSASPFGARAAYARKLCLREPGESFWSQHEPGEGVPLLLRLVPQLPEPSRVCGCGYVIPCDVDCEECETREAQDQATVVAVASRGRLGRPPELGRTPRPETRDD